MTDSILTFTEQAAIKVGQLIAEEGNFDLKLRAYVTGGGCSGFQYGFTFEETIQEDDSVIKKTVNIEGKDLEVVLIVDPLSIQYLQGAEITYKEDLEGEQFIIKNPNAKTTCGCGSSFNL